MERTFEIDDPACAQAVFGPFHRHLALIQDAFRAPGSTRSAPSFRVTVDAQGNHVMLRAAPGSEAELDRAWRILEALTLHYRSRKGLDEGEVLAAVRFTERAEPDPDKPGPAKGRGALALPQFGGLTLRTPRQAHYVEALRDPHLDLVFAIGPAGTGKTYLAVAAAVEAMKTQLVDRIVVTRPAIEAGERLGFLPGDLSEKVDPYLQPIWDAFRSQNISEAELKARRESRKIEVAPLAFMRGRTLSRAFVIVDEAQNATIAQMKMVLTRLGEGSRMVVTGDPTQIDLPRADMSGLAHALTILEGVEGSEVIRFEAQDVVRHRMVARIIAAYEAEDRRRLGGSAGDV